MLSLIQAAGWPIWPLIIASIIALAIIGERLWSLRTSLVNPPGMLERALRGYKETGASAEYFKQLEKGPLVGRVLSAGLKHVKSSREVMKDAIEDAGRTTLVELERFLTTLGTIAAIAPLLGLFGTVVGMIEIFGSQNPTGGGNPTQLAHGISVALYNTAFGLVVAIPAMIFYRHFRGKINNIVVEMEQMGIKLVEIVHGERRE